MTTYLTTEQRVVRDISAPIADLLGYTHLAARCRAEMTVDAASAVYAAAQDACIADAHYAAAAAYGACADAAAYYADAAAAYASACATTAAYYAATAAQWLVNQGHGGPWLATVPGLGEDWDGTAGDLFAAADGVLV